MKRFILPVFLLVLFILSGCESDQDRINHSSKSAADEVERLRKELEITKVQIEKELRMTQSKLEAQEQSMILMEGKLLEITRLEGVTFEIIADHTNRNPDETVVLVSEHPENKREFVVLKAAVHYSDPAYKVVSLWNNREHALEYIEGNYDPVETHTGWPGFDARIGLIRNDDEKPVLILYLSRDDLLPLDFGKYRSQYVELQQLQ